MAKKKYVNEPDVWLKDKKFFKDNEEHSYVCNCYNGYAIGRLADEDSKAPKKIRLTYPKRREILKDKEKAEYVLTYRGLYDCDYSDITYGDIMMAFGVISK